MLMTLGLFVFGINTLSYQTLQRTTSWRHNSQNRIGNSLSYQFLGAGEDKQTLSGWQAPELSGEKLSLEVLRQMANTGAPYVMVDGTGLVHGLWIIKQVTETKTLFHPNGQAKRIEFSIDLIKVDDAQINQVTLLNSLINILA
ncbi:MAG: phage tail protein [Oceanospirillaceae bacterium]|nr:phage tail protein [Oceanospirillaceae bacterium]